MSKMKQYMEAKRLYLEEHLSIDEITKRLNLSRRTIFYWKKKYEWDKALANKRNKNDFQLDLINFTQSLMNKISKDMDNKTSTPQSEIYSLMNILKNIPQVKQYENSNQKFKQPKHTGQLTSEIIEQIEREVLGIIN